MVQRTFFYYAANKGSQHIQEWARKIEVNDDEHSFFMELRSGYWYVWCVEQNAWIHFFRFNEATEVLNKYVMGVWSDNFTAAFIVSFTVTVFVPDIEGIQKKSNMCMNWNNLFSECNAHV